MSRPDPDMLPRPRRGLKSGPALSIAVLAVAAVAGISVLWIPTGSQAPAPTGPGLDAALGGTIVTPLESLQSLPGVGESDSPTTDPTGTPGPTATPRAANSAPGPTRAPSTPKPPRIHLVLGAWAGQPWTISSLKSFSSMVGGTPGAFITYLSWPDRADSVVSDERAIARLGAAHVMTWAPMGMDLKSIWRGDHDAYIRQYAKGAAAYGKRFYIRLMHEMNGDWYSWGQGVNGNTPSDFVRAWRHVHDIFVAEGATKVKWVWSPNVRYGSLLPFKDLYPGSRYVDWVALDGYNWGLDPHLGQPAWQSFKSIFASSYRQLRALAPGKPVMIAEVASTENGGDKAAWILKTFLQDVPDYPAIKAVFWNNNVDGPSDFRVQSSKSSLNAFRKVVASSLWSGTLP